MGTEVTKDAAFELLLANATHRCRDGSSVEDYEPSFVRVLKYMQAKPEKLPFFAARFRAYLEGEGFCHELVAFCMHTVQLTAVRDHARALLEEASPRAWSPLSTIVESFEEDWADADLYEFYRRE